jgi:hypothetical protein
MSYVLQSCSPLKVRLCLLACVVVLLRQLQASNRVSQHGSTAKKDSNQHFVAGILLSIPQTPSEIPQMTSQVLTPFGRNLLQFINLVNIDREFADELLIKESVRLLGDLCKVPGLAAEIADATNKQWITEFLQNCADVPPGVISTTEQRLRKLGYS